MSAERTVEVVDEPDQDRFAVHVEGGVAELRYRARAARLLLVHTEVPDQFEGMGIGSALVTAGIDRARREHLTLVPHCRFAAAWIRRHPAAVEGVDIAWPPARASD